MIEQRFRDDLGTSILVVDEDDRARFRGRKFKKPLTMRVPERQNKLKRNFYNTFWNH
jgi:hypothetical protein